MTLPTDAYQAYNIGVAGIGLRIKVEYGISLTEAENVIPYIDAGITALREDLALAFPESSSYLTKSFIGRQLTVIPLEES
jgi:hypothetical protein